MAKERIYELAKELKMPSKALVKLANENGVAVKSHMSSVTSEQAAKITEFEWQWQPTNGFDWC